METPRLRTGRAPASPPKMARWGASGSLRTHADDERAGAVGQFRTTEEVPEQSRATGGGGDGGKGTGQGQFATAHHSPDSGPGQGGTRAGANTEGCTARQGGEIYRAVPSRVRRRHAAGGVLQPQAGCRTGRRRRDVAALRGGPGRQLAGPVA